MMHPHDVFCPAAAAVLAAAEQPPVASKLWSVLRFKGKSNRGKVYPMRLEFEKNVTKAMVRSYVVTEKRYGNPDYRPFNHFEIFVPSNPTAK